MCVFSSPLAYNHTTILPNDFLLFFSVAINGKRKVRKSNPADIFGGWCSPFRNIKCAVQSKPNQLKCSCSESQARKQCSMCETSTGRPKRIFHREKNRWDWAESQRVRVKTIKITSDIILQHATKVFIASCLTFMYWIQLLVDTVNNKSIQASKFVDFIEIIR